jgi:uncharacterized membrane protein
MSGGDEPCFFLIKIVIMKIFTKTLLAAFALLLFSQLSFAHDPQEHKKEEKKEAAVDSATLSPDAVDPALHEEQEHEAHEGEESNIVNASLRDFPTMHPLVVHFPIVLLLLAFLAQLLALFVWKKELSLVTGVLLLGGFVGAYLASTSFHAHTGELSDTAQQVLDLHDRYADFTVWSSGIALLLKIASHFLLKQKLWAEIIVAVVLAWAAYSVSQAGHYGATLVHLHGVGPQGEYLETHEHSH